VPRRGLDSDRVVDAAEELGANGLEQITFARLAALLGVKPPSLYNHVASRDALIRLIQLRGGIGLLDAIVAAAAGLAGDDALRATAHAYRDYAKAYPARYEATLAAPRAPDPELEAVAERLLGTLASILRGWQLEGDDAIDAIRIIRSALHGFVSLERAGGFAMARSVEASFERLVQTLIVGLR
jgi:AcrR family transcriptional regulator